MSFEIIVAIVIMVLLFLRQVSILKDSNKVNYAPIILSVGIVFALLHFILSSDDENLLLTSQESLISVISGIVLYSVINILQQTKQNELLLSTKESYKVLESMLFRLKDEIDSIQDKLILSQNNEKSTQDISIDMFKFDQKALEGVQQNQAKILERFELASSWYKEIVKLVKDFTKQELSSSDEALHKHMELLKSQADEHYAKTKAMLQKSLESRVDIKDDVDELKQNINSISTLASSISTAIISHTKKELNAVAEAFEKQLNHTIVNASSIDTKLYESGSRLDNIKQNSEVIMRQMVLSSKKMTEIETQGQGIHSLMGRFSEVLDELEKIKSEYIKSQASLHSLAKELESSNKQHISTIKNEVDFMVQKISAKVEDMVHRFEMEHSEDISENLKILTKRSQLKNSYLDFDS